MKTPSEPSDSQLVQSILAGDEEALTAVYRRWQGNVYRFALHMCGSPALAEDVTQEAFMVLINEGHNFNPTMGSLNAFLLGVARNHVLRHLHRERLYVPIEENSDCEPTKTWGSLATEGPLENLARVEAIQSVRKAVLSLPTRYREVVVLCELQEMSYAETADILGCAIGTVRSRLHRARALLIEKLNAAYEDDKTSSALKSARCFA